MCLALQGQRSSQVAARSCEEYQAEGPLAAPLPGDTEECTPFAGLQAGATLHASPEVGQGPMQRLTDPMFTEDGDEAVAWERPWCRACLARAPASWMPRDAGSG